MIKVISIEFIAPFTLKCYFSDGEIKLLDVKNNLHDSYASSLWNSETFAQAKIGELGEIYWEGIGEIKNEDGISVPCHYDISPEFAYHNSKPI